MNLRTILIITACFAAGILVPQATIFVILAVPAYLFIRYQAGNRKNKAVIWMSYAVLLIFTSLSLIGAWSKVYGQNDAETMGTEAIETVVATEPAPRDINLPITKRDGEGEKTPLWERLLSFLGIFVLIFIAWLLSVDRRHISWKPVIWGIILQIFLGLIVLSPGASAFFFDVVDGAVKELLSFAEEGATFVFQTVEPHQIVPGFDPHGESQTFIGKISPPVKTFAFWVLPTIIFFSSLMTILYHSGVMEFVIRFFAWVMQKTMGTSGSETLSAAANIFVGQTEAPLVVKPFIEKMTMSELHAIMVGGFATVAGGVMAAYVSFLQDSIPGIAGHLVTASIMSAPAALAVSKVMMPETEESLTRGSLKMTIEKPDVNVIEAAARGATEGMTLTLNVAAMLVAFVGMVAMINALLTALGFGIEFIVEKIVNVFVAVPKDLTITLSLERILGWIFSPIAFCMGIPWSESTIVGRLLGEKLVLTEFIAYMNLGTILKDGVTLANGEIIYLSQRSAIIASYALCGFANFASIGIQLGGIGGIAPSRRGDLAKIGLRAMLGGAIAACLTGTIAGIIIG